MAEEEPKTNEQEQPQQQPEAEHSNDEEKSEKTFTRAELAKAVKSQLDEAKKSWQKETADAVAKAKEEGKQEANMTADELAKKQTEDHEKELNKLANELKQRAAELDKRDHLAHTKDLLSEQHLPTSIAETVLGETEEETKSNIDQYKKLVEQGVRNELHRSSTQQAPQEGGTAANKAPNKPLAEMNYQEMQAYLDSQKN